LGRSLSVLGTQVSFLLSQAAEEPARPFRRYLCEYTGVGRGGEFVCGFALNAIALRSRELLVKLVKLSGYDILLFIDSQDAVLFLVTDEFLLRRFDFQAQVG